MIAFLNFKTTPSSPSLQYPSLVAAEIERYFCLLLQWSKELIQLEGHFNNIRDKIRFPENYIFTWFPSTECCKQISESHQTNEDVDKTWLQVNVFVCQNHDGHNITWKYKYDILTGKILKVSHTVGSCSIIHIHFWVYKNHKMEKVFCCLELLWACLCNIAL